MRLTIKVSRFPGTFFEAEQDSMASFERTVDDGNGVGEIFQFKKKGKTEYV